jgi:ribose transport system ATP-binding protein
VLRDGVAVGEARLDSVTDQKLIEMIVGPVAGKLVGQSHRRNDAAAEAAPPVCSIRGLHGALAHGIDLDIHRGEIVGLAGLLGSGAEDVPALCFGARRATAGTLELHGRRRPITSIDPALAVRERIALVPADRRRDAIAPTLTVAENVTSLVTRRFVRFGAVQGRRLAERVGKIMEKFDIRPRRPNAELSKFSGGNAQKTVLAKWLEIDPRLLLLHEPTHGVDVAARAEIYRHVRDAADGGMATLWVSSDFDELATVCDRVLIVAGGVVRQKLAGDEVSASAISSAVYNHSTATLPEVPA